MEHNNLSAFTQIEQISGTVFDIERFSLHDGPGIRTVVYLKGCPLHCSWCANPESNRTKPQIGFYPEKCTQCHSCAAVCPNGEQFLSSGTIPWDVCCGCLKCVDVCFSEARVAYGRNMTAGDVVKRVLRDRVFFQTSGGGVTLSGGEVTMQPDFAAAILALCRQQNIHTAIETSGFCKFSHLEKLLAHVDLLQYDFKCMLPQTHLQYTGADNQLILENARLASELVPEMVIRWPVIPGVNDSQENAAAMAQFLHAYMPRVKRVDLLPYHSTGKSKCERIGIPYRYTPPYELTEERVRKLCQFLQSKGLDARNIG